jgi:DNA-binding LacI/PurR family transcriptional regulator
MSRKGKNIHIYNTLKSAILDGSYAINGRLPTEVELCVQFQASRPTVGRALGALQEEGLVERIAGSGTFVRQQPKSGDKLAFGLLIPQLGQTEIFEPICGQIAQEALKRGHSLLWGSSTQAGDLSDRQVAEAVCRNYIEHKVRGVFFAPLEHVADRQETNQAIIDQLDRAGIRIVLLDRDYLIYPQRSRFDLVGIHNNRAGYVLAEHLIGLGAKRIEFCAVSDSAPTVFQRHLGCQDALRQAGLAQKLSNMCVGEPEDAAFVRGKLLKSKPDAVICANDATAARLLRMLNSLGVRVPADLRVAAFDDVGYAKLLHPALTTIRQPCRDIGTAAMLTMLERLDNPSLQARDILLDFELVIRESCGAK